MCCCLPQKLPQNHHFPLLTIVSIKYLILSLFVMCIFALHKNVLIKTVRDEAGGHNWLQPFDPLKCIQKNFWHAKPIFVTL